MEAGGGPLVPHTAGLGHALALPRPRALDVGAWGATGLQKAFGQRGERGAARARARHAAQDARVCGGFGLLRSGGREGLMGQGEGRLGGRRGPIGYVPWMAAHLSLSRGETVPSAASLVVAAGGGPSLPGGPQPCQGARGGSMALAGAGNPKLGPARLPPLRRYCLSRRTSSAIPNRMQAGRRWRRSQGAALPGSLAGQVAHMAQDRACPLPPPATAATDHTRHQLCSCTGTRGRDRRPRNLPGIPPSHGGRPRSAPPPRLALSCCTLA